MALQHNNDQTALKAKQVYHAQNISTIYYISHPVAIVNCWNYSTVNKQPLSYRKVYSSSKIRISTTDLLPNLFKYEICRYWCWIYPAIYQV